MKRVSRHWSTEAVTVKCKIEDVTLERKLLLRFRTVQPQATAEQVLYKDHTIIGIVRMSTPAEDPAKYISVAMISWKLPDRQRRIMYCLTLEKLFRSVEDARSAAIERAKAWVDYHNREFEPLVTQVS